MSEKDLILKVGDGVDLASDQFAADVAALVEHHDKAKGDSPKEKQKILIVVAGDSLSPRYAEMQGLLEKAGHDVVVIGAGGRGFGKIGGMNVSDVVVFDDNLAHLDAGFSETTVFRGVPRGTLTIDHGLALLDNRQDAFHKAVDALAKGEKPMFEDPENWEVRQLRGKWMLFMYKGKSIMRLCKVNRPLHGPAFGIPSQQYHYNWQSVAPGTHGIPVGKLGGLHKTNNIRDAFEYAKNQARYRDNMASSKKGPKK